ncbi:MAG: VOC family protein [Acidobacteriaceae bacterium]|nr:VOC family protein [Acidobacteriaceae bacterium]
MAATVEPLAALRTAAIPRLTFKDVSRAMEFYTQAFGAQEKMRFEVENKVAHAEIVIGESVIHLSQEWPEGGRFSAETLGQSPVQLNLQVADVDSFAATAIAAGLKPLGAISDQFYGERVGNFVDPFGYTWNISTTKEEMSVEEMHRRFRAEQAPSKKPEVDPVPKGFRTITPYMIAKDGPGLLEFAKQAFGGEETMRGIGSAGGLHGEIRIGDSMLMIGGGIPGREFRGTPSTIALHVYVKDTDAAYRQALAAGATSLSEPAEMEYGERSAGLKDPAGNFWYIATHHGPRYVPEGLNDVNVYMHPLRADPMIRFLQRAFGARELARYASPDGVVHHAQIRVGSSVLEMGEAHGRYQPTAGVLYLYVPDVDATYKRALQAGATSISEPADQPYGDRNAGVKDPFGNTWYIATPIEDAASHVAPRME